MSNLHPLFVGILATMGAPLSEETLRTARVDNYVRDLKLMDWQFEHSDDHSVWKAGTRELARLRAEQRELDPDGALWRQHAHADYPVFPSTQRSAA